MRVVLLNRDAMRQRQQTAPWKKIWKDRKQVHFFKYYNVVNATFALWGAVALGGIVVSAVRHYIFKQMMMTTLGWRGSSSSSILHSNVRYSNCSLDPASNKPTLYWVMTKNDQAVLVSDCHKTFLIWKPTISQVRIDVCHWGVLHGESMKHLFPW